MNDPHPRYVILGTGPLGLSVMDSLLEHGFTPTLVNRRGQVEESLPDGIDVLKANIMDAGEVARVCRAATVVFHCAQPPYNAWPEQFPPLTQAVLDGVARAGAKLVFGDNLYMYGPQQGRPLREDIPYAATDPKGVTRARVADMLLDAHQRNQVQVALGRGADFYGPRATASTMGEQVFGAAVAGKTVNLVGNIDQPHTYTYISDFGRDLVTLALHEEAFGHVWHIPSAETLSTRDFVDLISAELGAAVKVRTANHFMLRALGLFMPPLREISTIYYQFDEPFIVEHSKFAAAFGANPTPHRDAIRTTLAWYRRHASK
jgi:nucleoside-diphosphate-sugar epimerase